MRKHAGRCESLRPDTPSRRLDPHTDVWGYNPVA